MCAQITHTNQTSLYLGDAVIRCDQMSLLLRWVLDFQSQYGEDGDLVAFDVLCGDLNFDNCSTDDCMEQKHQLFSVYKDPCRDCAGQDRRGAVVHPPQMGLSLPRGYQHSSHS
ncbi:unnamed protein product [Staurois parvus]|uniref:sphingomyelin phosphodiesterase n=1 Tax=Staurois parvus TaxID=386267 RepID=A0ABN9FWD3_9NEOB|nr:unnamed protein product [Staurois parvus]